MVFMFVLDDLN